MRTEGSLTSRRRLLASFALLAIIALALLAQMFVVFQAVEAERQARSQVTLTNAVLLELRNVVRATLSAETGQRGYLITLDRKYLAPYAVGDRQYDIALKRLHDTLGGDITPRQEQLLDRIENLTRAKFAEMRRSVALVQQGELLQARREVLTDEGRETMDRLRRSVVELEQIENARLQEALTRSADAEARLIPLLSALLLTLIAALGFAYTLIRRNARAEAAAAQAAVLTEARDRADLLARELNHRAKNIYATVLAIVRMSGRNRPEAAPVVESIAARIRSLLTAYEVSQGSGERGVANLRQLIETILEPYRSDTMKATLGGPDVSITSDQVTPLGLVLHEMTTNAVKYGAWAHGGTISVTWEVTDHTIHIAWREQGADQMPQDIREGFGSQLMTSSARQLHGTITRRFEAEGVAIDITLPA